MSATKVKTESIITNGEPHTDTLNGYRSNGYELLGIFPANKFHPYAMNTDRISFFAKPIDKVEYDAEMKAWREKTEIPNQSQVYGTDCRKGNCDV